MMWLIMEAMLLFQQLLLSSLEVMMTRPILGESHSMYVLIFVIIIYVFTLMYNTDLSISYHHIWKKKFSLLIFRSILQCDLINIQHWYHSKYIYKIQKKGMIITAVGIPAVLSALWILFVIGTKKLSVYIHI